MFSGNIILFIYFIQRVKKKDSVFLRCVKGVPFSMKGIWKGHLNLCSNGTQKGERLDLGLSFPIKKKNVEYFSTTHLYDKGNCFNKWIKMVNFGCRNNSRRICTGKNMLCPAVLFQWFSKPIKLKQALVTFQVFKQCLILSNILPVLLLSSIITCQQLSSVVINSGKGFWTAKFFHSNTKPSNFCIL